MDYVVAVSLRGAVVSKHKLFTEAVQAELEIAGLGIADPHKIPNM